MASFERTERSAVNDHFGWHPSTGPDVDERHGHVFENNLLAADERFPGPLLQFFQSPAVRERLKDPQVKELDGNVYVRRAGAKAQPLIVWSPVQNGNDPAEILAIDDLRKLDPQFEAGARVFADYWGPLFKGVEVGDFELMRSFPGANTGVKLPAAIRDLLNWNQGEAAFPGAYPPRL